VESLVEGLDGIGFAPAERSPWGAGQGAEIRQGDRVLGALGQADPALADRFDLTRDTYIFELELPALFEAWSRRPSVFRSLPKFPPVERDLAVVLDEGVPAAQVAAEIRAAAPDLVERVDLFDVYQGGQVETGKRSLAFSLRLRSAERTLEDGDADKAVEGALERLRGAFGARLRQTGTPRRP
jgi:phenylalanyl-tRNA synthetase beta chain